jgi:hypothetical protein
VPLQSTIFSWGTEVCRLEDFFVDPKRLSNFNVQQIWGYLLFILSRSIFVWKCSKINMSNFTEFTKKLSKGTQRLKSNEKDDYFFVTNVKLKICVSHGFEKMKRTYSCETLMK